MAAADHTINLVAFLFVTVELVTATHVGWTPVDQEASYDYKLEPANFPIAEADNDPRRQLAPFQLCLPCKCCSPASPVPTCTSMPCCFGINCQIPNKPFGFCAFVPKTCNCTSCAV